MKRTSTIVFLVILIVLLFAAWQWRNSPLFDHTTNSQGQLVGQAQYQCDQGKTVTASFYQSSQPTTAQPGQPPQPNGYATVALSDGRTMTLSQTISADGARYSDGDPQKQQGQSGAETFVLWSKGNTALVLENNVEKSYTNCIKVAADPGGLPQVYTSNGISIRYPSGYTANAHYTYQELGPGKDISGVKFTIPASLAQGTNLGSDSYVSVEWLASTTSCTADKFLDLSGGGQVSTLQDGGVSYSYASTTGAGAGNRYEEQVFAIPGTNPCIAVRYFVHYSAIENYPQGAAKQFDEGALLNQFDSIRRTLTVGQ